MKTAPISVEYIQHCGSDLTVVNAARVSFHKTSEWVDGDKTVLIHGIPMKAFGSKKTLSEQDAKLINYLAKHKHFSPFNHSFITLRVKAPIFVARQLVKHKFMPWNEVSRRYVDDEPEFYWPDIWREKAENVKQGSASTPSAYMKEEQWDGDEFSSKDFPVEELVSRDLDQIIFWYEDLIKNGVCAEQARMVLPQSMMTEWFWSGTLGAYCDMLRLRLDTHTQYESRIVAQQARAIIEPLFPVSVKALLSV